VRLRMESLSEVRDLLKSIDRRLSAIERHLGIASAAADPPPGEDPPAAAE